jgi:hypothetical protein
MARYSDPVTASLLKYHFGQSSTILYDVMVLTAILSQPGLSAVLPRYPLAPLCREAGRGW